MYSFVYVLMRLTSLALKLPFFCIMSIQTRLVRLIDLFANMAAILISIVSEDIMGCSGGKLICICPLGIP